jgi:hypothetical protein
LFNYAVTYSGIPATGSGGQIPDINAKQSRSHAKRVMARKPSHIRKHTPPRLAASD